MQIKSIAKVLDCVEIAGSMALDAQRRTVPVERSYKRDGSVLTKIDKQVEDYLFGEISRRFPDANVITEETVRSFDPTRPYTFAIDPIDGTDVFSQGMAGWCISVGLMDERLDPVAGIVFSPRLDVLVFADVEKKASFNGKEINLPTTLDPLSARSNIMVSSRIHEQVGLADYPGKIRSIGSAALHLCFPLIYPGVAGAIQHSGVHIWDIAGAHAINLSHGLSIEYLSGEELDYSDMVDGSPAADVILSGPSQIIDALRTILTGH